MANNIIQLSDGSGGVIRILNDYTISDVATLVDIFTELPTYHTLVCRVQPVVINTMIGDTSLSSSATCTITKNDTYILDVLYTRVGSSVMGYCRYNFNTGVSSNNKQYPELGYERLLIERTNYTTTANTWFKINSTFTLTKQSLVWAQATFNSNGMKGIALQATSAATMSTAGWQHETEGSASQQIIAILPAGTYNVWIKPSSSACNNQVIVYKLAEIG